MKKLLKFLFGISPNKTINLDAPVKLRLNKDEFGRYYLQFYNPLKERWWFLPHEDAGIHAPWSFEKAGSLGAYSLKMLLGDESSKNKYRTFRDIQNHFDKCNERFYRFERMMRREDEKPNIINL
jgi:hypothetical protein